MRGNSQSVQLANTSQLLPASVTAGKDALSPAHKITEPVAGLLALQGVNFTAKGGCFSHFFRMLSGDNALIKVAVAEVEDGRRRG